VVRRQTSRTVRIGLLLFGLGLAAIVADVVPFLAGDHDRPLWLNLSCVLAPVGFAIAVGSGLRAGRDDQRAALRESRPG
jgi:uncharacterized membrane protein YhdT